MVTVTVSVGCFWVVLVLALALALALAWLAVVAYKSARADQKLERHLLVIVGRNKV